MTKALHIKTTHNTDILLIFLSIYFLCITTTPHSPLICTVASDHIVNSFLPACSWHKVTEITHMAVLLEHTVVLVILLDCVLNDARL